MDEYKTPCREDNGEPPPPNLSQNNKRTCQYIPKGLTSHSGGLTLQMSKCGKQSGGFPPGEMCIPAFEEVK